MPRPVADPVVWVVLDPVACLKVLVYVLVAIDYGSTSQCWSTSFVVAIAIRNFVNQLERKVKIKGGDPLLLSSSYKYCSRTRVRTRARNPSSCDAYGKQS